MFGLRPPSEKAKWAFSLIVAALTAVCMIAVELFFGPGP